MNFAAKVFNALFLAGLFLFATSCTTNHNTFVTRTFHNTTARFNGYFYANESVKDGLIKLEKTRKEDYSKLLPVFIYPSPDEAKSIFPEMDKSIKKLSVVIHRHTITNKAKKEIPGACKWIDRSYILMGRSHFYKRDFFAGMESFEYVAKTYKKLPSRFLGTLWLIRTYDELGSISESESLIDLLSDEKDFPKEYKSDLEATEAYHFILRENYGGAMKPLAKAIALSKSRKDKARYTYVEAQLEQKAGKLKRATTLYSDVIRLRPSYEMSFNAQISRARCYDVTDVGQGEAIKKELKKMLKDLKNNEYFDQVYYTLAEISEKEKNMDECIKYLRKSIKASVNNKNQKALSFLKLADINFDRTEYRAAQSYYDSTVALIKKDFPNYELINNKKKSLSELVKNMIIISNQDSLQKIARMNPADRDARILEIMAQMEEEEKRKEEEHQNQALLAQQAAQNIQQQGSSGQNNGAWYYYNSATVAFGAADFKKKWGDRKLEDNWRRSTKEIILDDGSTEVAGAEQTEAADTSKKATTAKKVTDKKSKDFYLQNLPLTENAMKKSTEKVVEAFYTLGSIYREQLYNNKKAAETFEEMMQRYPENKYKLSTYYQLYRLYLAMGMDSKADYYKNIFLTQYPETEYAKIIRNPGYNADKQANISQAEKMYAETYQLYKDSNYLAVISKCREADTALGQTALLPKFDLLNALAIGRTQGIDAFEGALTRIIIKHPKGDVKDKAQEYLDLIKKQRTGNNKVSEAKKDSMINNAVQYLFDKDAEYYWVFIYEGSTDIDKIKAQLSNIHSEYYSIDNLKIENIMLDNVRHLVYVKSFVGKEKAMTYFNLITKDKKDIFTGLDPGKIKCFVISADNFPLFYKSKNIGEYLAFFEGNFLKKN